MGQSNCIGACWYCSIRKIHGTWRSSGFIRQSQGSIQRSLERFSDQVLPDQVSDPKIKCGLVAVSHVKTVEWHFYVSYSHFWFHFYCLHQKTNSSIDQTFGILAYVMDSTLINLKRKSYSWPFLPVKLILFRTWTEN